MIAGLIGGYFYARFLGPEDYGIWRTAIALGKYAAFLSLGIPFAMRRDFVQLRSEKRYEEAREISDVVFSYSLISKIVAFLAYIIAGIFFVEEELLSWALIMIGILQFAKLFYEYGRMINTGHNKYNIIAKAELIRSIVQILTIPFVYYYGFNALLIIFLLMHLVPSIYYYLTKPLPVKWNWDRPLLKKLLFIGLPMYLSSIITVVFTTIDRLLIFELLSSENVGYYSLGALLITPAVTMIKSSSPVLFTRLNEKHGFNQDPKIIRKHVIKPQLFFSKFLPPFFGIAIVALPIVTDLLLPEYKEGIPAAQIRVFAIYSQVIAGFAANALFILGKQKFTAILFAIAGVIKTIGSYWGIKLGYGIESVALASVIGFLIYDNAMFYIVNKKMRMKFTMFLKTLFNKMAPLIWVAGLSVIILYIINPYLSQATSYSKWTIVIIGELIMIISCLPLLYNSFRDMKKLLNS